MAGRRVSDALDVVDDLRRTRRPCCVTGVTATALLDPVLDRAVERADVLAVDVLGIGSALPDRVVTNDDWAATLDTDDEWIRSRTGIAERRFAALQRSPKQRLRLRELAHSA